MLVSVRVLGVMCFPSFRNGRKNVTKLLKRNLIKYLIYNNKIKRHPLKGDMTEERDTRD